MNNRKCSAGVDIRTSLVLAQPLTGCEYQLFYSRFCKFQKCMDSLVDLLQVCFSEGGLDKQNSSVVSIHVNVLVYLCVSACAHACTCVCVCVWALYIERNIIMESLY